MFFYFTFTFTSAIIAGDGDDTYVSSQALSSAINSFCFSISLPFDFNTVLYCKLSILFHQEKRRTLDIEYFSMKRRRLEQNLPAAVEGVLRHGLPTLGI